MLHVKKYGIKGTRKAGVKREHRFGVQSKEKNQTHARFLPLILLALYP